MNRVHKVLARHPGLLLIFLLQACATTSPGILPNEGDNWRLVGKLSLRTAEESRVLGINWLQTGSESAIDLSGPLGVRVARITAADGELVVDTGRSVTRYQNDASIIEPAYEGLKLPWQSLAYWVRGKSGPGSSTIGEDGISEGSWHFQVLKMANGRPDLMRLEHPSVSLKLKVKKWLPDQQYTDKNPI